MRWHRQALFVCLSDFVHTVLTQRWRHAHSRISPHRQHWPIWHNEWLQAGWNDCDSKPSWFFWQSLNIRLCYPAMFWLTVKKASADWFVWRQNRIFKHAEIIITGYFSPSTHIMIMLHVLFMSCPCTRTTYVHRNIHVELSKFLGSFSATPSK